MTGNLDYDEDIDMSPNMQWITVGSSRGYEALTPITRIVRQNFLPFYVGAAIYDQYADGQVRNVSNQNWLVPSKTTSTAKTASRSSFKMTRGPRGWTKVTDGFPEACPAGTLTVPRSPSGSPVRQRGPNSADRITIVIANLKYTTSVGPVSDTTTVFNPSAFPELTTYVAKTTPIPATGTYNGLGGGTAVVSDVVNPTTRQTTRTVVYTNYVNEDGLILNGRESSSYGPNQLSVTYVADIDVTDATGANRGRLDADAAYTLLPTQSVTGYITSTLDGDTQTIPDPTKVEAAKTGA